MLPWLNGMEGAQLLVELVAGTSDTYGRAKYASIGATAGRGGTGSGTPTLA